ncbi:187-kDa microtubule-associated protein AIR9 [Helianthus annuus]|uniref:187-kDa microtubule-associated protein AIR9 n=1 Tax=Helianthus annuus TaxID=4232 RepID=UPI000B90A321|nr:187-kDa microtubule-associated protein AIR9 [Helianthus annuus]
MHLGFPVVSRVNVKALSLYSYPGEGIYFGGYEGSSIISWFRENMDGTSVPINGANSYIYEVTDEDYNCRLIFGYTPVHSDLVVRELKMSEPTNGNYEGIKKLLSEGAGLECLIKQFYGSTLLEGSHPILESLKEIERDE